MAWLNTTITTDKGPQSVLINCDNVRMIKQTTDGRALVVFVAGQAHTIDNTYVWAMSKVL